MAVKDNVKIGVCEVYLDFADGNGEQSLGQTKGGVTLTIEREFADLSVDKWGNSPLDKALVGERLMVVVRLAELSLQNLAYALPSGLYAESGDDAKLGVGSLAGWLASEKEATMRLHPVHKDHDDRDEDVYIFRAVPTESLELNYVVDEQRVVEVTFEALVDENQPNGQYLGRIGDADIS